MEPAFIRDGARGVDQHLWVHFKGGFGFKDRGVVGGVEGADAGVGDLLYSGRDDGRNNVR